MTIEEIAEKYANYYEELAYHSKMSARNLVYGTLVTALQDQRKIDIEKALEYFKTLNLSSPKWIDDFKKYMEE